MKNIELTRGYVAIVDDWRYEEASQFKWWADNKRCTVYAARTTSTAARKSGEPHIIYLHRFIANAPPGVKVDHKDGNGLNCTDGNLRLATDAGNSQNSRKPSNNTSGYKGVYWYKPTSKWGACISVKNKIKFLGYFLDIKDAALAYDAAALKFYGEFANPNFPSQESLSWKSRK